MKPFSCDDLFLQRTLQGLDGSTSHPRVAFLVSRAVEASDSYESIAWLVDTGSDAPPRRLTSPASSASSPLLDPGGNRLAFLSSRDGTGGQQVQLMPVDGGEAAQLTNAKHQLQTLAGWSSDGTRLLATARVAWAEDEDDDPARDGRPWVVDFLPWKMDGSGPRVGQRTHLLEIDAASGEERMLASGDFDVGTAQWSPDGSRLAYVRSRDGTQRHLQDLWLADADGGDARQVTRDLVTISGIRWSPDGRRIAFGGSCVEGDSISHLWLFDVESGAATRPCGEDLQLEGSTIVWHADGRRLATIASRRGLHELVAVSVEDGGVRRLDSGLQHVAALCPAGDRLLFVAATMRCPDELHSVGWDGGDVRRHGEFNHGWFAERARPRVEKRAFDVPDGEGGTEAIDAWVLLPADGEGPFPLLVDFHGGPQSNVLIDFGSHVYWYALLSAGWAIVAPNAVGSGGYGTGFARRMCGRWGEIDLPQHIAVIEALQREGLADDRLACTGKSYGGFLGAWAIAHDTRFRAAVISAPVANLESHTGTSDTGYYVGPYAMGGELAEERARYHALSPVQECHTIRTPTLLLQGEDDQRCPLGQSEEIFAHLVRCAEASCRMVVYPGGSHRMAGTGKPSHRLDYHRRLAGWMRRWATPSD